ncbi:type II toxin-antitoxin system PemK/MazF family toxin [Priestia filamentosa]|uniref:type II toxin-antitoxin system PemK/MazF family toxin n=1 Tax=Priestia filamentosa TaxID=1402861 RepID=UPI0039822CCF
MILIRLEKGIGSEQRSLQPLPALIMQNSAGNKYAPTVIVAPVGMCRKKRLATQVLIPREQVSGEFKDSVAMLLTGPSD